MQDSTMHILGALSIIAALAASHPPSAQATAALEYRLANAWHEMATNGPCGEDAQEECLPAFPLP